MSVFGNPTSKSCDSCPGITGGHKAIDILTKRNTLIEFLKEAKLIDDSSGVSFLSLVGDVKRVLYSYIVRRLGKKYATPLPDIYTIIVAKDDVVNKLTFNSIFRVYTHAQGAKIEYIKCTENGDSRTKATRAVVDTYNGTRWVEHFSTPLVELDHDMNYIMLDESDKACMFYEKPGAEFLSKITKHEAEAFMSKHGLKADMAAMGADMRKDYGDLMDTVTSEARALRLRL